MLSSNQKQPQMFSILRVCGIIIFSVLLRPFFVQNKTPQKSFGKSGFSIPLFLKKSRLQKNNAKLTPSQFGRLSNHPKKLAKPPFLTETGGFSGASDLTRTGDLLITSEMHYRLCYTSITSSFIIAALWKKVKTSDQIFSSWIFCGGAAGHQRSRGAWWGRGGGRRGGTWRSRGRRPGLSRCRDHG